MANHVIYLSALLYFLQDVDTILTAAEETPAETAASGSYTNIIELFNLEKLLMEFRSSQSSPPIMTLMKKYNQTCAIAANVTSEQKRSPFIVIESVYDLGRKVVAHIVASAIDGYYSGNPPKLFAGLSKQFDGQEMRAKYYALCKYAGANLVKNALQTNPVVMERYYYDQAVYSLAITFADSDLPTVESKVYDWPADLLKPDMVFFLNYIQTTRPSTNPRIERMIEIFRRMRNPKVTEIQASHSVQSMAIEIVKQINQHLGTKYRMPRSRFPTLGYTH